MKKKKTTEEIKNTTAWPFELDQLPAFTWDANFLTNEECDKLIALGKKLESKAGRIGGDAGHELKKMRRNEKVILRGFFLEKKWSGYIEDYVMG